MSPVEGGGVVGEGERKEESQTTSRLCCVANCPCNTLRRGEINHLKQGKKNGSGSRYIISGNGIGVGRHDAEYDDSVNSLGSMWVTERAHRPRWCKPCSRRWRGLLWSRSSAGRRRKWRIGKYRSSPFRPSADLDGSGKEWTMCGTAVERYRRCIFRRTGLLGCSWRRSVRYRNFRL